MDRQMMAGLDCRGQLGTSDWYATANEGLQFQTDKAAGVDKRGVVWPMASPKRVAGDAMLSNSTFANHPARKMQRWK